MCNSSSCDECRYWANLREIGRKEDDTKLALRAQHEIDQHDAAKHND